MGLFKKKEVLAYDKEHEYPVIRKSICTGERVFGFRSIEDNKFRDVALIRNDKELEAIKESYSITNDIKVEY